MQVIQDLLKDIQTNGVFREDRTGTGIQSVFGRQIHFDTHLGTSFPAITLRKFPLKTILHELLWFIKGTDNCDYLDENNVKIWQQWTEPNSNSVGNMYGVQLRNRPSYIEIPNTESAISYHLSKGYKLISTSNIAGLAHLQNQDKVLMYKNEDVLQNLIDQIKNTPISRRHVAVLDDFSLNFNLPIASLWNYDYLPDEKVSPIQNVLNGKQALANCHGTVIQFNVNPITQSQLKSFLEREFNGNVVLDKLNLIPILGVNNHALTDEQLNLLNQLETQLNRVIPKHTLSLQMYQRSADIPTAVGFNVGQYAILLYMVAHICNMLPHHYIHVLGDAHIYNNQLDVVKQMLERKSLNDNNVLLKIKRPIDNIDDFKIEDFELINYKCYPDYLSVPVAY